MYNNNQFGMPYPTYGGYGGYNYNMGNFNPAPQQQPQVNNLPPKTNIMPVTSLQDAMLRPAEPNSVMVYADQDKPLLYRIHTDWNNRKTTETLSVAPYVEAPAPQNPQVDFSCFATKEELKALQEKLDALTKPQEKTEKTE